jgi:hypothetical protein
MPSVDEKCLARVNDPASGKRPEHRQVQDREASMSIAGISASNLFQSNFAQAAQDRFQQIQSQFKQLGQDLQSGNLTEAQADFAALAKELPQTQPQSESATGASTTTSAIAQAFKALAQDLQAGNLSAAQQDFAAIQQDPVAACRADASSPSSSPRRKRHAARRRSDLARLRRARPSPALRQSFLGAASLRHAAIGLQQYLPDAASNSGSTAGPSRATNSLPASPGALSATA